jgi:hypothetical protein
VANQYYERGASPTCIVYFEAGAQQYPCEGWTDFGCTVLVWWLCAVKRLLTGGAYDELLFMDGPHAMYVTRSGDRALITTREGSVFGNVTLAELTLAIIDGASIAAEFLNRNAHGNHDAQLISKRVDEVRACLK